MKIAHLFFVGLAFLGLSAQAAPSEIPQTMGELTVTRGVQHVSFVAGRNLSRVGAFNAGLTIQGKALSELIPDQLLAGATGIQIANSNTPLCGLHKFGSSLDMIPAGDALEVYSVESFQSNWGPMPMVSINMRSSRVGLVSIICSNISTETPIATVESLLGNAILEQQALHAKVVQLKKSGRSKSMICIDGGDILGGPCRLN